MNLETYDTPVLYKEMYLVKGIGVHQNVPCVTNNVSPCQFSEIE